MVRLRSLFGSAPVLLVVVGAVLAALAFSPRAYEAQAIVATTTMSDGTAAPPASATMNEVMRGLFPASAAEAHRVQLVQEPDTIVFRVVARDQKPAEAARPRTVAAQDLVTAGELHPAILGGATMTPVMVAPASSPPVEDRSALTLGAVLAIAAGLGLMSVRLLRSRPGPRTAWSPHGLVPARPSPRTAG